MKIIPGRNPKFTVGQTIIILAGWVERGVVNPDKMGKDSPGNTLGGIMPAPDLGKLPKSLLLGSCGMPGNTAYFGLLELCEPKVRYPGFPLIGYCALIGRALNDASYLML